MFSHCKRAASPWPCAVVAALGITVSINAGQPIVADPLTGFEIGGCGQVVFDEICTQLFRFDDGGHYSFSGLEQYDVGDRLHVQGTVCLTCLLTACGTPYSAFIIAEITGCLGDLDADGDVDGVDLANLLGQWGPCPVCITTPCPCPADLNGDGRVNGIDLGMLLGAWAP